MAENRRRYHLITKTREPTIRPNRSKCIYQLDPAKAPECFAFLSGHLKVNGEIATAEPGIYTWIIKQSGTGLVFVAARAMTAQEIGTLHANLDELSREYRGVSGTIIAAGEMQLDDVSVEYNFMSGTYMARAFKRGAAAVAEIKEAAFGKFVELFAPGRIVSEVDKQILFPFTARVDNIATLNRYFTQRPYTAKGGVRTTKRKHPRRKTVRRSGLSHRRV